MLIRPGANQGFGFPFAGPQAQAPGDTGGSDTPDWVPANAKIHIYLIAPGRAWTEDDGEVAIDTLLGSDPNTVNAWDTSEYNPANLSEFGYTEDGNTKPLGLIGGLRTKVLAGCTIKLVTDRQDIASHSMSFALVSADGNHAVEVDMQNGQLLMDSWDGPLNSYLTNVANSGVVGSKNTVAITTTPTRLEAAISGGATILSGVVTGAEYPISGDGAIVAGVISITTTYLQSITIYDALPNTTGLSALSETGVTNTAPTAITIASWAPSSSETPTFTVEFVSAQTEAITLNASLPVVSDAEGNPCTITMTDDGGGKFQILDAGGAIIQTVPNSVFAPGTYNFTLRATDPGGLYVEQAFTLTVTA